MVVDGNNILMRAVKAMEHTGLSSHGVATGPLVSFINTLSHHAREERPDSLVVCWDSASSDRWRNSLQADYKGTRADSSGYDFKDSAFALAKEFCSLANIIQETRRTFEADDLIAARWRLRNTAGRFVILSNDKDFLQLLDPGVEQIRVSSGGAPTDRWDYDRVIEDVGVEPERIPLVMALTGDVSDNVIGVRGIGPVKAKKMLAASDWHLDSIDSPVVQESLERVKSNLGMVDLRNPPVAPEVITITNGFKPTSFGSLFHNDFIAFLQRYELRSVLTRYLHGELWGGLG